MHFSIATSISAVALLSSASARIIGISAPKTIAQQTPFTLTLLTENYIQSVYDVSMAFGISPNDGYPSTLGPIIYSVYLGPTQSNTPQNLNISMTLPEGTAKGEATINSALTSLYGASFAPVLGYFNVSVEVGDVTSGEYVRSA